LIGGNYDNPANNAFLMPWDIVNNGTEDFASVPMSSGTASKLVVSLSTAESSTQTATIVVRKNGVDTALTCTVPNSQSTCMDLVNQIPFADGDLLSFRYNEVGTQSKHVRFTILYTAP
jgi:hypothetical protein